MKFLKNVVPIGILGLLVCSSCGNQSDNNSDALTINLKEMKKIGTVDERFQSYNVEMVEVVGGEFWRPYKTMEKLPNDTGASMTYDISDKNPALYRKLDPVNLADQRLLNLAKGLAPAYVRVSGTWANATYFQDDGQPARIAPEGFVNVMTSQQLKGVVDFLKATNSELVTSFAVSKGVRDANGNWTPVEAQKFLNFLKSNGATIAAAELFNEPTMPTAGGAMDTSYNAQNFAKDVAVFNDWAKKEIPAMVTLGPGSIGEGLPGVSFDGLGMNILTTEAMMSANPKPQFDGFSYHYYGAGSMRIMRSGPFSIQAKDALNNDWITKTDHAADFYISMRDKYTPGKPMWLTETAEAAGGGDPFAATYLDCFRYLYQMGSLAQKGVQVVMHNTLAASEYSLIDQDTHLPKPNYWAALLWAKLMGTEVYDAGKGKEGVYVFAHNTKGVNGGMTLLVINTNKNGTTVNIPSDAEQYTLTSKELEGTDVQLNGADLKLTANDELPEIKGKAVKSGDVTLPELSFSFITFANAGK